MLTSFSGCNKEFDDYIDIFPVSYPTEASTNPADSTNNSDDTSDAKGDTSGAKGDIHYQIPVIKTADDFQYKIYIDPDYNGGDSDGTIEKPYPDMNSQYAKGVPSNTAFLFKRGTTHPRLGRHSSSGGILWDMVYKNNLIGAYGEGKRPVIQGIQINGASHYVTIRDLEIAMSSQSGQDIVVQLYAVPNSPTNIVIAYNIIRGVYTPNRSFAGSKPHPYPEMGIRGGGDGTIVYHNEIYDFGDNGVFGASGRGQKVVKNYVYNINRKHWGRGLTPAQAEYSGGDPIMYQYTHCGLYIAGNYTDPAKDYYDEHPNGNDYWKQSLIFKVASNIDPVIVEYNTAISQPVGTNSGAAVYFHAELTTGLRFRYNFIAPSKGKIGRTPIASSGGSMPDHINRKFPDGLLYNHIIRQNPNDTNLSVVSSNAENILDESNLVFDTWEDYNKFLLNNGPSGSDIDPDNFWESYK